MPLGGFRSPLPLPFALGGGTIVPVQTGAATPVTGRDLVSLLNISKEMQQLREGVKQSDIRGSSQFTGTSEFGRNVFQALNAVQVASHTTDRRLRNLATSLNSTGLIKDPAGNIVFSGSSFVVRAGNATFAITNGYMLFPVNNTPPEDSLIPNGHAVGYLDETADELLFRVRYSDGTLKTGIVTLV